MRNGRTFAIDLTGGKGLGGLDIKFETREFMGSGKVEEALPPTETVSGGSQKTPVLKKGGSINIIFSQLTKF